MNDMEFPNEAIEQAIAFIKSVEERMVELKNNPELLREASDKHDYLYHDNQAVKALTTERYLTLCLKDGRVISIRELKNKTSKGHSMPGLIGRFKDLKSITYDSDSK